MQITTTATERIQRSGNTDHPGAGRSLQGYIRSSRPCKQQRKRSQESNRKQGFRPIIPKHPYPSNSSWQSGCSSRQQNICDGNEHKKAAEKAAKARANEAKEANKLLKQAITGDEGDIDHGDTGNGYFANGMQTKIFGTGAGQTKNCGGAAATARNSAANLGRSLINDIVCLCLSGHSGGKRLCDGETTALQTDSGFPWQSGPSPLKSKWQSLMKNCPSAGSNTMKAEVHAALAAFNSLIGSNPGTRAGTPTTDSVYTLGLADNTETGCTGSDKQTCINYKPLLGTDGTKAIPWQTFIKQALQKKTEDAKESQITAAIYSLQALNRIWLEYSAGFTTSKHTVQQVTTQTRLQPTESDCNKHTKSDDCKDPCKWNEKATDANKKCSLDPKKAAEQAEQAGTGEGAAASGTSGCARHGNKSESDADKTGDKQNCALRKGKDSESEPKKRSTEMVVFS